jgi:hypothetical protein
MLVVGALVQTAAFIIQAAAPPFPVFAISYALAGFGGALQVHLAVAPCIVMPG